MKPLMVWTCIAIAVAGAGMRIAAVAAGGPVSFDEAWTWYVGTQPLGALFHTLTTDKHPPLQYLLMHFWAAGRHSEVWVRIPSLIASLAAMGLFFRLARRVFSRPAAVATAFGLFAFAPFQVEYAAVARSYALATLCAIAAVYTYLRLLEQPNRNLWPALNALANLCFLLTHYIGVFAVIAQGLHAFVLCRHRSPALPRRLWVRWALPQCAYLGIAALSAPFLLSQVTAGGMAPAWIALRLGVPGLDDLLVRAALGGLLASLPHAVRCIAAACALGLVLVALVQLKGFFRLSARADARIYFLLLFYAAPLLSLWLISQVEPMFVSRYFIPFDFAWLLVVTHCIFAIPLKRLQSCAALCLVAVLLASAVNKNFMHSYEESHWDIKCDIIRKNWAEGDVLLILPLADAVRFLFYFADREKNYFDKDLYNRIFWRRPESVTPEDLTEVFLSGTLAYRRIWFHEELDTGLADEFYLQHDRAVYSFLRRHFAEDSELGYRDARGVLSLFYLK